MKPRQHADDKRPAISEERELNPAGINDSALLARINVSQQFNPLVKNPLTDLFFLVNSRATNDLERQTQALNTYLEYDESIQRLYNENKILRERMQNLEDFIAKQRARKIELDMSHLRFKSESARKLFISAINTYFYRLFYSSQTEQSGEYGDSAIGEFDAAKLKRLFNECVVSDNSGKTGDKEQGPGFKIESYINNIFINSGDKPKDDEPSPSLLRKCRDDYKLRKGSKTPDSGNSSVKSRGSQSVKLEETGESPGNPEEGHNLINQLSLGIRAKSQKQQAPNLASIDITPAGKEHKHKGGVKRKPSGGRNLRLSGVNTKKQPYSVYNNRSYQNNTKQNKSKLGTLEERIDLTDINSSSFIEETKPQLNTFDNRKLRRFEICEPTQPARPPRPTRPQGLKDRPSAKIRRSRQKRYEISGFRLFTRPSEGPRSQYRQIDEFSILNPADSHHRKYTETEQSELPIKAKGMDTGAVDCGPESESVTPLRSALHEKSGIADTKGPQPTEKGNAAKVDARVKTKGRRDERLGSTIANLFRSESRSKATAKLFDGKSSTAARERNKARSAYGSLSNDQRRLTGSRFRSKEGQVAQRVSPNIKPATLRQSFGTFATAKNKGGQQLAIGSLRERHVSAYKAQNKRNKLNAKNDGAKTNSPQDPAEQFNATNTTGSKLDTEQEKPAQHDANTLEATSSFNTKTKEGEGSFFEGLHIKVEDIVKKYTQPLIDLDAVTKTNSRPTHNCFTDSESQDNIRRFETFKPGQEIPPLNVDEPNEKVKDKSTSQMKEKTRTSSHHVPKPRPAIPRQSTAHRQSKGHDLEGGVRKLTKDFKSGQAYKPNFFEKTYKRYKNPLE